MRNFTKNRRVAFALTCGDERTEVQRNMMKLAVAPRNCFAKAANKHFESNEAEHSKA